MFTERLQILLTPAQRRRLEREAQARGSSVAGVVREAIDAQLGEPTREERLRAVEEIGRMEGRFLPPPELERLIESEREDSIDALRR